MSLILHRCVDASELHAAAGAFLEAREAEHNLMIGLLGRLRRASPTPSGAARPYFAYVSDGARIVAASLRTPPHQLAISHTDDLGIAPLLARDLRDVYEALPGVLAQPAVSEAFARAWCALTGARTRLGMQQAIYRAEHADRTASSAAGTMRWAAPADRDLLIRWFIDFITEAVPHEGTDDVDTLVDRRLTSTDSGLVLWDLDGTPVALAGYGGPTPHGIRIGPVYTPPPHRARGYGTALTAALTHHLLTTGRRFCFLYTDLANPTSNSIYRRIGYERVSDSNQWLFE